MANTTVFHQAKRLRRATVFMATAWLFSVFIHIVPEKNALADVATPPESPTPDGIAEAQKHFQAGLALYKDKQFEAALIKFESAYKLSGRPSALRNLAQTHRDLKQYAAAFETFSALMERHGTQLASKDKSTVQKALDDLKLLVGKVSFVNMPADAQLTIDSIVYVFQPNKVILLNQGIHKCKVTKGGFDPFEVEVKIESDKLSEVSVKLVAEITTGKVIIRDVNGLSVPVYVDDVKVGLAPWEGEINPGSHQVQLRGEKAASEIKTILVQPKTKQELVLLAAATTGTVRVRVTPANGRIIIDDNARALGGWSGELSPGTHTLTVTADGYESKTLQLTVAKGKELLSEVVLTKVMRDIIRKPPQQDWIVPPPSNTSASPFEGMYARLSLAYHFGLTSYPKVKDFVMTNAAVNGTDDFLIGGALNLHVGYSFGVFGLEFVSAFQLYRHRSLNLYAENGVYPNKNAPLDATVPHGESHEILSLAGFFGAGARVTSKDASIRVTGGFSVGGVYRSNRFRRAVEFDGSEASTLSRTEANYFSPGFMFELGLLMGDTPGNKFYFGMQGWLEIGGAHETNPLGNTVYSASTPYGVRQYEATSRSFPVVTSSVQFFLGPVLGLSFGH